MKKFFIVVFMLVGSALAASAQTATHHNDVGWTWAKGTGAAAGSFNVYRGTVSGGPYAKIGSTPLATLTFSDTDQTALTDGSIHFYVIRAVATDGITESANSNELKLTTPFFAPTPATGLTGTAF